MLAKGLRASPGTGVNKDLLAFRVLAPAFDNQAQKYFRSWNKSCTRHRTVCAVSAPHSFYAVLGISHNATLAEVKSAYRRLVKQSHPDRNSATNAAELHSVGCAEA